MYINKDGSSFRFIESPKKMDANNKKVRKQAFHHLKDYLWQHGVSDVILAMLARWLSIKGVQGYSVRVLFDCFERLKPKGKVACMSEGGCAIANSRWGVPGLSKGKVAHSPGFPANASVDDDDADDDNNRQVLRDFYGEEYIVRDPNAERSGSFADYFSSTSPSPRSPLRAQKLDVYREPDSAVVGGERWQPYTVTHPVTHAKENKLMSDAEIEEEEQLKDALLMSAIETNTALVLEEQRQMAEQMGELNKTLVDLAHRLRSRERPRKMVIIDTGSYQFVNTYSDVAAWTKVLSAAKRGECSLVILNLGDADAQIDKIIGRDVAHSITRGSLRHANVAMHKLFRPPTTEGRVLLVRMLVSHIILDATRLLEDDNSSEPIEVFFCGSMLDLCDKDNVFTSLLGPHTRVTITGTQFP